MLILTKFIRNLSQPRVICCLFEASQRVYAFGSADAFSAFETFNSFLRFEAFLRAKSLHGAIICEIVGESVHLQGILFV